MNFNAEEKMRNIIGVLLVSLFFTMKLDAAPYVIGEYKYIQPNGFVFLFNLMGMNMEFMNAAIMDW